MSDFCNSVFNITFMPSSYRAQVLQPQVLQPLYSLLLLYFSIATSLSSLLLVLIAIESLATQLLIYYLLYSIITILDLWREWTIGLGEQLLVEVLDKCQGSCQCHGVEFQFYSRCKVIIDEIKRLVVGEREVIDIVNLLEEQCLKSKTLLSQVINVLKAMSKAREQRE